jgi:hypothetical protein
MYQASDVYEVQMQRLSVKRPELSLLAEIFWVMRQSIATYGDATWLWAGTQKNSCGTLHEFNFTPIATFASRNLVLLQVAFMTNM